MANCTKCGTNSDHPLKVWKIKQTPIALFECPSCKKKWRSKLIETQLVPSTTQPTIAEQIENVQTPTMTGVTMNENSISNAISTMVENHIVEYKPAGLLSGIRAFFSYIFWDLT